MEENYEKPFRWEIKIALYGRDEKTNRILDFKIYLIGYAVDSIGREMPPERTMHVVKVADDLDSNISEEEITYEKCLDLIMKSLQPGQLKGMLDGMYNQLYPGVTYFPATFKQ